MSKKNSGSTLDRKTSNSSVLDGGLSPATVAEMKKNFRKGAPRPSGVAKEGVAKGLKPGDRISTEELSGRIAKALNSRKASTKKATPQAQFYDAMTVEEAMERIGWTVVEDGHFHLRDIHGSKIRLANNSTNRPFRIGLANRYKSEYLRAKWKQNGESIIFDWDGKCQSGQHRLTGFILAEEERREDRKPKGVKEGLGWKDLCQRYWGRGGPLTMPCLIVTGIDPAVANTIDQGLKRTNGDVLYQQEFFANALLPGQVSVGKNGAGASVAPPMTDVTRKKLCNVLAGAARLVWLRAGGKSVSDAPHFPLSESLDFITQHPKLEEFVVYIWGLEGGTGKGGQKISKFTTLAYAAGLAYLMAASNTDPDTYAEQGADALDFKNEKKAKEFWAAVASGANLSEDSPIYHLREMMPNMRQGSGQERDEVVGMIIKAFSLWMDKKKATAKDISMPKDVAGKLTQDPRLGGMDVEGRGRVDELDIEKQEDNREGTMADKKVGWQEGDEAWVRADDGKHWYGVVTQVIRRSVKEGGHLVMLRDVDTGREWEEPYKNLWLKYPG